MRKYKVGIIISILVLVIGYVINNHFNPYKKQINWLEQEIPKYHLLDSQDSIRGRVKSVFSTRGFAYIVLQDSQRIAIGVSRNGNYKESFIGDFLKSGDDLHKVSRTDTFYIYKDNLNHYFVLGKIINEK